MLSNESMGFRFVWWIGVVEDRHDPLYLGRCKVRILGWHTEDKEFMKTSDLPWCFPLMPITSASQTSVGQAPVGPVEGTWVMGFFKDGENAQDPMMLGTLPGIPEQDARAVYTFTQGFYDSRAYDSTLGELEHAFSGESMEKRIRSLINGADNQRTTDKVPREPAELNFDKGPVNIVEQEKMSPYPDFNYLNQPTTPPLARGFYDSSSGLRSDGLKSVESPFSIIARKRKSIFDGGHDNIPTAGQLTGHRSAVKSFSLHPDVASMLGVSSVSDSTESKFVTPSNFPSITVFREPQSPYNARYPYNHVTQTESGHVFEMDDTPDAERIHLYHRSGSFLEYHNDGTVVNKSTNKLYNIIHDNLYQHISGQKLETVDGGYQLFVNKDSTTTDGNFITKVGAGGSYYSYLEEGNYYFDVGGTGSFNTETSKFVFKGTTARIEGDTDIRLFARSGSLNIKSSEFQANTSSFDIQSQGSAKLKTINGNLTLGTELGAVNINVSGAPGVPGSGINMTTGLSPIEIGVAELTEGSTGWIKMFLGKSGTLGRILMLPGSITAQTPGIMVLDSSGLSISSKAPIKMGSAAKSLKSCFDDLIDEIAKITVPTGSGNSGTPLNTSQLQALKLKIAACII
jgi:hypothetical protein